MRKTRKPVIGGALTIISGVFALLGAINYAIGLSNVPGFGQGDIPPFVPSIILGIPLVSIIIAILALTGGVFQLLRANWSWALAGSIAGALSMLLLGLPAVILIALSKDEFV